MIQQIKNQEAKVFELVEEYLNENHVFDFDKILPYIISRFAKSSTNINTKGVIELLEKLTEKNLIIVGSKLTKNEVLLNPNRKKLYDFIIKRPGVYFNQIVKKLNFSHHVIIWHVQILLKFNFIKTHEIDNREVYFDVSIDLANIESRHIASRDKAKRVLEYLKANDIGAAKTKIAKELNMHLNTITKYLDALEETQAIFKENIGNSILYFLIEDQTEETSPNITSERSRKLLKEN